MNGLVPVSSFTVPFANDDETVRVKREFDIHILTIDSTETPCSRRAGSTTAPARSTTRRSPPHTRSPGDPTPDSAAPSPTNRQPRYPGARTHE